MSYKKLGLANGNVLKAEHIEHIENGISTIYDDLYDVRKNSDYKLVSSTVDSLTAALDRTWSTSTFSGWYHYCGTPQNFD